MAAIIRFYVQARGSRKFNEGENSLQLPLKKEVIVKNHFLIIVYELKL